MFPKYDLKILITGISIVLLCGIMFPILSYPWDLSLFLSVLLNVSRSIALWGIILIFINLILHYTRKRRGYKFKEFGMTAGISFIPLLVYNIFIPILNNLKSVNLINAWDINLMMVSSNKESFQILFFFSRFITILCVFFFLLLLSFSIRDTFNLELIKAIYLCIFIVIIAYLISDGLFTIWEFFDL
ncbi:MAG: hypothetical protein HWN67_15085 [Candidatus Helarchaeota archaeon]|nr:hypothetical protein [Candidatus Helarchaeota archaeon]